MIELKKTLPASSTEQVESHERRPEYFHSTLQECLFVLTTTVAVGAASVFSGAILCMTGSLGRDLNMTAAEISWCSAAQNLASGAFLLFFGRVADLFGRRILLLLSLGMFTICLLIIGFATNAIFVDAFAGLLGLSSAACVPPAIGKLGAVYHKPSRRKNRAFACFSAGNPIGFVLGAFISGITLQISSWRAAFWVMAVIYLCFSAAAWWTVPPDIEQKLGGLNKETFLQFDFLGAFLTISGFALLTASLTLAGDAEIGWSTPYVIAMLVIGIVFIGAFVYWQSIFKYALMPLGIWKDREFTLLVSTLCLGFGGFLGNFFWLTLMWQQIYHTEPLMVAVKLLPAGIGGIIINIIAAMIMHRVSNKLLMIIGAVALTASSTLLSATSESIPYWALTFPALALSVVGADFQFTVVNMYVMSSVPVEQQSVAGGLFQAVSRLAATITIGVQTSVYNGIGGSSSGAGALDYRPYQATFWVSLAFAALGMLLVPFLRIGSQGGRKESQA